MRAQRHSQRASCSIPGCKRICYRGKLCQTHRKRLEKTGKAGPIRSYNRRPYPTVKYAGLRLSPGCARTLERIAGEKGLSASGTIAFVLEEWWEQLRSADTAGPAPRRSVDSHDVSSRQ